MAEAHVWETGQGINPHMAEPEIERQSLAMLGAQGQQLGMGCNKDTQVAIADRLAQPPWIWRTFAIAP